MKPARLFALAIFATSPLFAQDQPPLAPVQPVVPINAKPVPLSAVKVTGGPLKTAQQLDADYLLKLDPDRILFFFRQQAGLPPKATQSYSGWEGPGRNLTGAIAGHYLSALSYMYAATGDDRFKQCADYIVDQLKEVQDKQGDGYIGAQVGNAPAGRGRRGRTATNLAATPTPAPTPAATQIAGAFLDGATHVGAVPATQAGADPAVALANTTGGGAGGAGATGAARGRAPQQTIDGKILYQQLAQGNIRGSTFDLNGMWSPWYVEHKLFAGLRDAYALTGNRTALDVERKFAAWTASILANLTDAQIQHMLETEYGGMNEVLTDLYATTGDTRWLMLAYKFEHHAVVEPLARHQDILGGKHGNMTIPKLYGDLVSYIYTGNQTDGDAATFFWDAVVDHHTFATGGHGYDEYFGPADKLSGEVDGTGQRGPDLRTCESCNVYNMLKMTRTLFALQPQVRYAEFEERALFNHVLSSIDLKDGRVSYMVPIGQGVQHEYQDPMRSFTCCVGTGMESHALHGDGIYYETPDRVWVNLYVPSTADCPVTGAKLAMETTFPEGDAATLHVTLPAPKQLTLSLRRPAWAGAGFEVKVNGQLLSTLSAAGSFVDITRTWKSGDTISLTLPKALHLEPLPDNPHRVALMWGPLVLAGDMGPDGRGRGRSAGQVVRVSGENTPLLQAFLDEGLPLENWLKPVEGKPNTFHATTATKDDITFAPFYEMSERRYGIYWDLYTPEEWAKFSPATQPGN